MPSYLYVCVCVCAARTLWYTLLNCYTDRKSFYCNSRFWSTLGTQHCPELLEMVALKNDCISTSVNTFWCETYTLQYLINCVAVISQNQWHDGGTHVKHMLTTICGLTLLYTLMNHLHRLSHINVNNIPFSVACSWAEALLDLSGNGTFEFRSLPTPMQ